MFSAEMANHAARKVMRELTDRNVTKTLKAETPLVERADQAFTNGNTGNIKDYPNTLPIFTVGHRCIVVWDGNEFQCETQEVTSLAVGIGNVARYNGTGDSGEPFCIIFNTKFSSMQGNCLAEKENNTPSSTHSFAIYDTETIHPISDKYLPGVCLPVVELETVATADGIGVALTEEDSAKMDALDGGLCILCLSISGEFTTKACAITALNAADSLKVYSASTYLSDITVSNGEGPWIVVCTPKEV